MESPRKKALEDFAKNVERGIPLAEDYIQKSGNVLEDALRARNLAEEALAQKVLDNTGIPIPDKTAPMSRKEDFLNRVLQERYPEIKKPIQLKDIPGGVASYSDGTISLNKDLFKNRDIVKATSDVLHEGGHFYDELKKLVTPDMVDDFNRELRKLRDSGFDLKNADPAQVYELIAQKHHSKIPNLRQGTYGLGALKSYMGSGTFKAIPIIGTAATAAAALSAPDASAAAADLIVPGGVESLGARKGSEDWIIENPQANPAARRAALEKLSR